MNYNSFHKLSAINYNALGMYVGTTSLAYPTLPYPTTPTNSPDLGSLVVGGE